MNERIELPNRRPQTTFNIVYRDNVYWVSIGQNWTPATAETPAFYDPASHPVEVFVQAKETSSQVEALARDAAVLASFALQFGAPPEMMQAALTKEQDGTPASLVGAMFNAIVDAFPPKPPSEPTEGAPSPNATGGDGAAALKEGA